MSKKNLFVPKLNNSTNRSSFDLSRRVISSAKAGELLPCYMLDCLPGDKVKISSNLFTRLANLNTSNFARMKQYVNFYFVPYRLLFRDFPAFVVNQQEAAKQASSILASHDVSSQLPHIHSDKLLWYFNHFVPQDDYGNIVLDDLHTNNAYTPMSINHDSYRVLSDTYNVQAPSSASVAKYMLNKFGINRFDNSRKLLQYLGYYQVALNRDSRYLTAYTYDTILNIFPLLAYQKVYCDFYRFNQWESDQPQTYNIDYLSGANSLEVPIDKLFRSFAGTLRNGDSSKDVQFWGFNDQNETMFDLRYVNIIKDTLFGVVPSAQFGAESTIDPQLTKRSLLELDASNPLSIQGVGASSDSNVLFSDTTYGGNRRALVFDTDERQNDSPVKSTNFGIYDSSGQNIFAKDGVFSNLKTTFSIVQLRQAQALQKFREISLSNDSDYKSQIEAHFGVKVSSLMSSMCDYLGGFSADVNMSTVTNTNLTDGNVANYSAIGNMNGKGDIDFTCREHGIILGVSYVLPLIDVQPLGFEPAVLRTEFEDYALPEFDRLGNEEVDPRIFVGTLAQGVNKIPHLGYGPRYYDYKTTFDVVLGDFNVASGGTQPNYVVNFTIFPFIGRNLDILQRADLASVYSPTIYDSMLNNSVDAYSFKVRPYFLNNIFSRQCGNGNDDFSFDQFYNVFDFNVQCVRNLDYAGMPY